MGEGAGRKTWVHWPHGQIAKERSAEPRHGQSPEARRRFHEVMGFELSHQNQSLQVLALGKQITGQGMRSALRLQRVLVGQQLDTSVPHTARRAGF